MKKVYLVFASVYYRNGFHRPILLHVFSSYKKACIYRDYKELVIERDGADVVFGDSTIDFVVVRVDAEPVSGLDWSFDLKALQDEKL